MFTHHALAFAADLLPGFEPNEVDGLEIKSTKPCRQNAWCPGSTTTPGVVSMGYVQCPSGLWTAGMGATSQDQCCKYITFYTPKNIVGVFPGQLQYRAAAVAFELNRRL